MRSEFAERRKRVLSALQPGILLVFAAPTAIRNNDVEHEYRQDSDFFYLSGFDEPDSVLVLTTRGEQCFQLFVRPRDPEREVWDGARAGVDGAVAEFGASAAFPIAEFEAKLPELLQDQERLFYRLGKEQSHDALVLSALERTRAKGRLGSSWPTQIVDPATVIHEMRLFKSGEEVELMRSAAAITRDAHVRAMAETRAGRYEYEIEAVLRERFHAGGAERCAYAPIVGSGPNATVLHYRRNNRRMQPGDLLLIDAGCEYRYYACDVTRTFPVSGKFSAAQQELYEIVLEAQLASIDATRPGSTLDAVHQRSVQRITEGLVRLGIIQGPTEAALEEQRYKPYFMHRTSHWLGMDVHDVGRYHRGGTARELEPGMVITVEPGIYISQNAPVPEQYRGIGIRIEDDVLVTREGHVVLTESIPKSVAEIEHACAA
ncbi:MAG TPA: Xaa-Pro aminopeptidase [Polyangiaceae bacterium]|nr:Xaa-Pro aminopeptidase [Polyangiaceae bacterium]